MKITEDTSTRLVLAQKSYWPFILGAVFIVVGIYVTLTALFPFFVKNALLGLLFIFCGSIVFIFNRFITLSLDKSTQLVTSKSIGILGVKSYTLEFAKIKEVAIEEYLNTNNTGSGPRQQLKYNLVLYMNDGQGYPIQVDSPPSISIGGFPIDGFSGRNKIIEMGNKVASFIGVPFIDRRPPTLRDVVTSLPNLIQNLKPQIPNTEVPVPIPPQSQVKSEEPTVIISS